MRHLEQFIQEAVCQALGDRSERQGYRNGYRDRVRHGRLGMLERRVPKLREGSYFPSFLEPGRLNEQAIAAVEQEAWINSVKLPRFMAPSLHFGKPST